jgi:hypothetical protein
MPGNDQATQKDDASKGGKGDVNGNEKGGSTDKTSADSQESTSTQSSALRGVTDSEVEDLKLDKFSQASMSR